VVERNESLGNLLFTVLVALLLTVIPLPHYVEMGRPAFLVLTVLYWSVAAPRLGGISLGFFSGLVLDLFRGAVLGQNALALAAVTYIFVREHQKIRLKPVFQQSLIVCGTLVIYEFILFVIDGWSGHPLTTPWRWLHAVIGAIIWPLVSVVLDRTRGAR